MTIDESFKAYKKTEMKLIYNLKSEIKKVVPKNVSLLKL